LNISESPPTFAGTGFKNFLPSRFAGIRVMFIGWFIVRTDSSKRTQSWDEMQLLYSFGSSG
jgi:hypothetical protein